ncbi:MAG: polysaccharide deacetylase family protein [Chloroflexota bacterium]|nr:polysaccharide deacetylase family protein [Chloroflexota bacterium]
MPRANELLGYPPDARLLIVNADDFGAYHAVNAAILRALTDGVARSTTLMVPCPWALHAMRLLRDHPGIAFGVHLTVVAEFADYRWGPLAPRHQVPSLLDETGSFYSNDRQAELLARARPEELEVEFRAQIEAVLKAGLRPSHLDWHCLRDGGRPDVFDLTVGLAEEYGLALRVFDPARGDLLRRRGLPAADHGVVDSTRLATAGKAARFARMLRELPPGLSEWAVHPGLGTAEARAIDGWWAKRAADLRFLVSREARETVTAEGIVLLDYRALQAIWSRDHRHHPR